MEELTKPAHPGVLVKKGIRIGPFGQKYVFFFEKIVKYPWIQGNHEKHWILGIFVFSFLNSNPPVFNTKILANEIWKMTARSG